MALITAATGGDKAHAVMLMTLKVLSAKVAHEATLLISFVRVKLNDKGEMINTEISQSLASMANALLKTIDEMHHEKSLQD